MPLNANLYKAVVRITNSSGENDVSFGSGVVFSPAGLVITNNHVLEDPSFGTAFGHITVESIPSLDRPACDPLPADIVIRNEIYDLAVIKINGRLLGDFIDLLNAPLTDASLMERHIRVLGYPPLGGSTITVTRGIVSGFGEDDSLKTDAEINSGNSGGAVLDDLDTFLGLPSFTVAEDGGKLGFIISLNRIRKWFAEILMSGVATSVDQLTAEFVKSKLKFGGDNLDQSTRVPRILGKFAAVELLLARREYEKAVPQIEFILDKRPRSALAYHYLGNALLGLGRYLEAALEFRTCLAYNPGHIPALGNLGVTLMQLRREGEALQIFEQIIDVTDDPAQLWASYENIAKIYERWNRADLSALYRQKARELNAAAAERLSEYAPKRKPGDKVAALVDAIVNAEISMEDQKTSE